MGLGKTVATLTAISDMLAEGEIKRVLVIAPLRVARNTWIEEIRRWEHVSHLKVAQILGTAEQRRAAMRQRADVYLINRENVQWLVAEHFNVVEEPDPASFRGRTIKRMGSKQIRPWIWDTVVIDESSSFKNHLAKRWRALRRVRKLFKRCIELTGTPSPNGLMDLWAQLYLLDQGQRLGGTITTFRNRWFEPPGYNQFKWKLKTMTDETGREVSWARKQIQERVKDVCFALKAEDYLDLPPVMYRVQKAFLTDAEMRQYKELERRSVLELRGQVVTALNAGALANKLLQLANGAVYTQHPHCVGLHERKLDVLELARVIGHRDVRSLMLYYQVDADELADRL
jgi:SNF2 family DNA or RNA helicase